MSLSIPSASSCEKTTLSPYGSALLRPSSASLDMNRTLSKSPAAVNVPLPGSGKVTGLVPSANRKTKSIPIQQASLPGAVDRNEDFSSEDSARSDRGAVGVLLVIP